MTQKKVISRASKSTPQEPGKGKGRWTPNYKKVLKVAGLFPTDEEMAVILGCSRSTITRLKLDDKKYLAAIESGQCRKKIKLRKLQWEAAEAGNVAMLKHLGKQYLGQADKVDHASSDGSMKWPTEISVEYNFVEPS